MRLTAVLGGALLALFIAVPPVAGANGLSMLKDINPGGSSNPGPFVTVDDVVYFAADDGVHGRELWRSDGTSPGTRIVRDINPGSGGSYLVDATAVGSLLFFQTAGRLWVTDGRLAGTKLLGAGGYALTPFSTNLYYIAGSSGDAQLWRSDGTVAGTSRVRWAPHEVNELAATRTRLFIFSGGDYGQTLPGTLYATDGTSAGLRSLGSPAEGWKNAYHTLTAVGELTFFVDGPDLWRTNGTRSGTRLLSAFGPDDCCYPDGPYAAAGLAWVIKDLNTDAATATEPWIWREIWRSDGTRSGTFLVSPVAHPNLDFAFTAVGGRVFWSTVNPDADSWTLWGSDGTAAGTHAVSTGAGVDGQPDNLVSSASRLFFSASDGVSGRELWSYQP